MTYYDERPDSSPVIAGLLEDAFVAPVTVDTASRHLWVIHSEAAKLADEQEAEGEVVTSEPPVVSLMRRGLPRAAVPLLAAMMMMSFSGVAVAASKDSLPGDALYAIKRGAEQAQLIFVRDPVTRAELQLSFAQTRLTEIERIAEIRPQHVPDLVTAIAVTLDEVERADPEVAARVQPATERIRRETTASIVQLPLPRDVSDAAASAMTPTTAPAVGAADATTAAPVATVVTPSTVPSANGAPSTTPSAAEGGPATATPTPSTSPSQTASDVAVSGDATAQPSATPEDDESEEQTATGPTTSPSASASEHPTTRPPSATTGPSTQPGTTPPPSSSPTPEESPSEAPAEESEGPVVTSRPQPTDSEDSGESRADDEESADGDASQPTTEPTEAPPTDSGSGPESEPTSAPQPAAEPQPSTDSQPAQETSTSEPSEAPSAGPTTSGPVAVGRPGDVAE